MANNFIDELHMNVFINNPLLEVLDIGNNKLHVLPGTILRGNDRMVSLGLRRNAITSIQRNFFDNMPHLRVINLQTNDCINQFFTISRTIAIDVVPFLDTCFRNYEEL